MAGFDGWLDPELEALFRDRPELAETARLLRAARPQVEPDPHFRLRLRGRLLAEAQRSLGRRRAWWRLGPAHAAWSGAAVGAALIAATVIGLLQNQAPDHSNFFVGSNLAAQHAVSPGDVITVAFNQPMDQQAVEAGVHIQPATKVSYSWQGNKLIITPVHHLTGNTPYTVTIAKPSIRASSGATAAAAIQITFGTAATPPPAPGAPTPPGLSPTVLGPAAGGASIALAPDGSLVISAGLLPNSAPAAPTPATGTPAASPSSTAATGSAGLASAAVIEYPAGGAAPIVLGGQASAVAFAPGGSLLAMAIPTAAGGSQILVAPSGGGPVTTISQAASTVTELAWTSNERLIFADGAAIKSAQLSGHQRTLITLPDSSGVVEALSSSGFAFVAATPPATGGQLLNITTGTSRLLTGAAPGGVAFSADGKTIAWIDQTGGGSRLLTEPVDRDTPATVSTLDPAARLSDLALNGDGTQVAYVIAPASGSAHLVIAQLPSGAAVAVAPAASGAAFAPAGKTVGLITTGAAGLQVETATVPGAGVGPVAPVLPAAAGSALDAFVDAQVRGDRKALTTLSGPGVDVFARAPHGLSRAYVVSAVAQAGGTVSASVELIIDPTGHRATASVADETLTLSPSADGSTYLVTDIGATTLHDQSSGPHVVHVGSSTAAGALVLQISFDSDLDVRSLPSAVVVTSAAGLTLSGVTTYDANTRTATVTLASLTGGPVHVTVATSLRDIDEQAPAEAFQADVAA